MEYMDRTVRCPKRLLNLIPHSLTQPHGELWGVYCGGLGENWQRYNDIAQ